MMKYKSLTLPRPNIGAIKLKIHFHWNLMFLIGITSLVFFSLLYVFEVNKLTQGYYAINKYEKQSDELLQKNKDLQISLANNSVLEKIATRVQGLNFQQNSAVKYIYIPDTTVALKK